MVELGLLGNVVEVEDTLDGGCGTLLALVVVPRRQLPDTDLLDDRGVCWRWRTWL